MPEPQTVTLADADALFGHLDALNAAGVAYKAAGVDARGESFLAALNGVYADGVAVIFGDPWDPQVDYGTGVRCAWCQGRQHAGPDRLAYPVTVLLAPGGEQP